MKKNLTALFFIIASFFANAQNVGIGIISPVARLHVADSNVLFTGPVTVPVTTSYYPPAQGAGTRMMWYPQKAAFRVGNTNGDTWDFNKIGPYSIATGFATTASGNYSTAMGYQTEASGVVSTAMGNQTIASNTYSTAIGNQTTASGLVSTATGYQTLASGYYSTAMGSSTSAPSYSEVAIGLLNTLYTPLSATSWNAADRLFVIGNGNPNVGLSDAIVVLKNDNVGIGIANPVTTLHVSNGDLLVRGNSRTYYLTDAGAANNNSIITADESLVGGYAGILIKGNNPVSNYPNLGFSLQNTNAKTIIGGNIAGIITNSSAGSETMDIQFTAKPSTGSIAEYMRITSGGNVGIGTSIPSATAVLDVSSTTKGFLPPRMTREQIAAISTPAEGLIIYNTTTKKPNYYNGTEWRNFDGGFVYTIGDNYQGGIIAYILQPGDPGYNSNVTHGLIAAASDQSTGAIWGCGGTGIPGADGTALGTGNQNTIDIMAGCATAGIAARICGDLVLNGYSDWYLPSKDELNKLYLNKVAVGGYVGNFYQSSSEGDDFNAWAQNFSGGAQGSYGRNISFHVRAIRAF